MWAQICADIGKARYAAGRREVDTSVFADKNGVALHRHEIQRRGSRTTGEEARARLVKRWYQLEREQLGVKMEEQKLLVTKREIMLKSDEIRRGLIAGENADADGCYTVSQLAEMMEITVKELNKRLVAEGVQFRNGGRYMLTKEYEGRGYAQSTWCGLRQEGSSSAQFFISTSHKY